MAATAQARLRVVVDGKFFRLGETRFFVKGVAYGPFAPNAQGLPFASPEQTARDFEQIQKLGANVLRVYHVPPRWFLDLALEHDLRVLVDIPWNQYLCADDGHGRAEACDAVYRAVRSCTGHSAVFAYSVANEIPADLVRWSGPRAISRFIDQLVAAARRADPDCLCTFANFPPTEFLNPRNLDFHCFNVYLHEPGPFQDYLARLQMMAESKPLVLGEFGLDSLREGEEHQAEMLSWQIELAFRGGLAGAVVFTYADEWFKEGRLVEDWKMGLVTRERNPKPAFAAVQSQFHAAPYFPLARTPRISVVVASYNGDRTLNACLESLARLNYSNYEVILVDDGSTDTTPQIAAKHSEVRFFRHEKNLGLSIARNTGIAAAAGEVVAFTDSDCRADPDWLYYLAITLGEGEFAGVGGPNFLPPEDSWVAAAVMASPGGPAHVMLTDRQAEHIPGCNMAFHKWALEKIGGFDPIFTKAGDDVDLCWRLQQAGLEIGFSPAACVWHYRRSTVAAYLKQQQGYGEAEALLVRKHPENFNFFGGGAWRGRIYTASKFSVEIRSSVIYHGMFGSAGFQKLYATEPATILMLCTSLEYYLFVVLPLAVFSVVIHHLIPVAVAGLLLPMGVCAVAAAQADIPEKRRSSASRPLVALLFFLQPIARGWARYHGRLGLKPIALASQESLDSLALRNSRKGLSEVRYSAPGWIDRLAFVRAMLEELDRKGWPNRPDIGWSNYDVEVYGTRWSQVQLTTAVMDHHRTLHCRLRSTWSLAARITFYCLLGLDLLVIGLAGAWRPWAWLLLLTLPLCVWLFLRDERNLKSVLVVFLDELAKARGLNKIQPEPPVEKKAAAPASSGPFAAPPADSDDKPADLRQEGTNPPMR